MVERTIGALQALRNKLKNKLQAMSRKQKLVLIMVLLMLNWTGAWRIPLALGKFLLLDAIGLILLLAKSLVVVAAFGLAIAAVYYFFFKKK